MFHSKKDVAKAVLRDAILTGRYGPGQFLRQNDIAADLGLSSTPVREAFSELQATGLLVHEAHRGFRVASLDAGRLRQIYAARRIIEVETARLAVQHAEDDALAELKNLLEDMKRHRASGQMDRMMLTNDTFHRTLFAQSGNPFLVDAIERLWTSFPRFLPWTVEGRQEASLAEHERIIKALAARDGDAIARAYETHMDNALEIFLDLAVKFADGAKV